MARSRPGPGGPVPARSRAVARSRCWSGFGGPLAQSRSRLLAPPLAMSCPASPGPVPVHVCPAGLVLVAVARSRSRSRCRLRPFAADSILSSPGGRVPVPVKRITYAVWPASVFEGMDAQSLPRIWLFSKSLVRGKQYCEVRTIIRQKQEPNGCQSQLFDMKTLDVWLRSS